MIPAETQRFLANWKASPGLIVRQGRELAELIGFETRNKYQISLEDGTVVGFCAEQQKGIFGFFMRQMFGHWRSFDLHFFDSNRGLVFTAKHPFRFFFQRLEVFGLNGQPVGALQQRFGIIRKKFDIESPSGNVMLEMRSGFFQFWTFPISKSGREVAVIRKKWSGLLKEVFTDGDNFKIQITTPMISDQERLLILASSIFVDLQYFEGKANTD